MKDDNILKSETNPREWSVTCMMRHFTFSNGIHEMYQSWYYDIFSAAYPKIPKDYPNFSKWYDQQDESTQAQIKVADLSDRKQHAYTNMDIRMRKENWSVWLPLFETQLDKIVNGREILITRVVEDGFIYEGDIDMKSSIETYYRDQVQEYDRYELENRPTMKEWYEQLGFIDQAILKKVKRFENKMLEPQNLIYK